MRWWSTPAWPDWPTGRPSPPPRTSTPTPTDAAASLRARSASGASPAGCQGPGAASASRQRRSQSNTFLQKTRQKYNSTRSLASRLNLAEMTTDLNLHPPSYIKMHQLEPSPSSVSVSSNSSGRHTPNALNLSNGTLANGTVPRDISTVGVTLRLRPVPWYGWLAIFLAIPCVLLDVYRGAVAISMSSLEDPDGPSPWHGVFFLMETLLQIAQVHMLWKYNKFRKLGTLGCAVFVLVLTVFLLDVREGWLCFVYVLVSLTLMIATFCRPFERKLPRFHV